MNSISAQDTVKLLEQDGTVFIDVREPAEHAASHIMQATLAPLSKLNAYQLPEGATEVVVHCQKGMRAEKAIKQLQARYPSVAFHNLQDGIEGWQAAGLALTKGDRNGLALDRQVQLTIGSCVFAGSVLAATVSPQFLWLTGFFGAGLIFAGASGTCGLALVLARMPWNQ